MKNINNKQQTTFINRCVEDTYTPSPRCNRTRPSPSRERGQERVLTLNPSRERGNNKLSPYPVGEKVRVAGLRGKGFTLIELLVVVLIIGVLAAVALPQYQKAVERSRAAQVWPLLRAVGQAQSAYYMANGTYAENFEELDVKINWSGKRQGYHNYTDVCSNKDWSLQLSQEIHGGKAGSIFLTRLGGPYVGAGFSVKQALINWFVQKGLVLPVCRVVIVKKYFTPH